MRVESPKRVPLKGMGDGWLHRLSDDLDRPRPVRQATKAPAPKRRPAELQLLARVAFQNAGAIEARQILADQLHVSVGALVDLYVGWSRCSSLFATNARWAEKMAWTFPERDADGQIVGIGLRFKDGGKIAVPGSSRGLVRALEWRLAGFESKRPRGPLLLVEGPSDVAAAISMGFSVLGRPSNRGGGSLVRTQLCRENWGRRPIFVVGENDHKKPEDLKRRCDRQPCRGCMNCFPGKFGAIEVAREIAANQKDWRVHVAMPPIGTKDLRSWLIAHSDAGGTLRDACRSFEDDFVTARMVP